MKASLLVLLLLAFTGSALAAPMPPPDHAGHMSMDNLAVLLDLNDSQKAKVKSLLDQQHAAMKQAHEAQMKEAQQRMEQMRTAHEQAHQQLLSSLGTVLTPGQLKKFQILMEAHMHGPHMHMAGPHGMDGAPGCMPGAQGEAPK